MMDLAALKIIDPANNRRDARRANSTVEAASAYLDL